MTSHWTMAVPYAPRQTPGSDKASTISGLKLSPTSIDEHYRASSSVSGQNTPVSDIAPVVSNPNDQVLSAPSRPCYTSLKTRIEQLLEENELLAQEVRDMQRDKKERKNRKK
jgi:FtsZ-binding cell division protein ZapB